MIIIEIINNLEKRINQCWEFPVPVGKSLELEHWNSLETLLEHWNHWNRWNCWNQLEPHWNHWNHTGTTEKFYF